MNVYEKVLKIRCELQGLNLKKSGRNRYSGYDYYELGDFLPTINSLCAKYKLFNGVSFTADEACLALVDAEKTEDVVLFKSPMSSASLKGCHDIQNLGAVQTYLRRYLYMAAFEIVEHDELDAVTGATQDKKEAPKADKEERPTRAERSKREESTENKEPKEDTQTEDTPQEEAPRGRSRRGSEDAEETPRRGRGRR